MITNNKIRDSLILEKITAQEKHESKRLAENFHPGIDVYLHDDHDDIDDDNDDNEIDNNASFKRRRSKRLAKSNQKVKSKTKKIEPYSKSKKDDIK